MRSLRFRHAILLLTVITLAGCAGGIKDAYIPGLERPLTAQGYRDFAGAKAIVIVGSNRGLTWGPNIQSNATFQTLPRYNRTDSVAYDAVLIDPGTYVLESFLGAGLRPAALYSLAGDVLTSTGMGAASAFSVNAGDVVYIGTLMVSVLQNAPRSCEAVFALKLKPDDILPAFRQQFGFVKKAVNVQPMTLMRSRIPYDDDTCF